VRRDERVNAGELGGVGMENAFDRGLVITFDGFDGLMGGVAGLTPAAPPLVFERPNARFKRSLSLSCGLGVYTAVVIMRFLLWS